MKENWQQDTQEVICGWCKWLCEDILETPLWINISNESLPLSQLKTSKSFQPYASFTSSTYLLTHPFYIWVIYVQMNISKVIIYSNLQTIMISF